MNTQESAPFTYSISVPQATAWEPHRAQQFMEQMLFAFRSLVFRIVATTDRIEWQIVDGVGFEQRAVEAAIRSSYPGAEIMVQPWGVGMQLTAPLYRVVIPYQYKAPLFVAPLQYVTELRGPDPLALLTQAMGQLRVGERIAYTIVVTGFAGDAYKEGEKLIMRPVYTGNLWSLAFPVKIERYTPELQRVLLGKLQQRLYETQVLIQIDSPDPDRLPVLLVVDNQMVQFDRPNFNGLCGVPGADTVYIKEIASPEAEATTSALSIVFAEDQGDKARQRLRQAMHLILEPRELASLWHLPHGEFSAATIAWSYPQVRLPARMVGQQQGVFLGVNAYAGQDEPVTLPLPDRNGHLSIVGKAGVGKSTLMHHLIHQDIACGRGVAVLDPHGALIRDVLRTSIPAHREEDVVILDLAQDLYPPPMNLLWTPPRIEHSTAAGQVMAVLNSLYSDFHDTPTVADTLWAALVTLLSDKMPTIRDVPRLLTDAAYRAQLVSRLDNAAAQEFWDRYDRYTAGQQEQLVRPIAWRMRAFYGNNTLYPILCHPAALDFTSLIAQNKIILVSLRADEARIPQREQQLLGMTLMSQLQLAVMTRPAGSTPYYLYIDEVQRFITTPLETVLSEARKFGLSLTLAHQYLKQLTGTLLDAVMGNIGAMIVFQCGLDDAKALAPYMAPGFDALRLINLNKYEAAVKLRYHDETQPAFSLKTYAPLTPPSDERGQARERYLRDLSIRRYTPQSREMVMQWLKERYARPQPGTAAIFDVEPIS